MPEVAAARIGDGMKCPKCKTVELRATRIEEDLPAAGCSVCKGALVALLYYRDWAERHANDPVTLSDGHSVSEDAHDTQTAMMCPKCGRLMTKYKISGAVANRLDVCAGCDEAWLDDGEWQLLKALELARKMPQVFTEQWQRNIRKQVAEDTRRAILRKAVGDPALEQVEEFKRWLKEQPRRNDILVYLHAE
jgi:Zn-finger nucleic acid-binding protein